MIEGTLQNLPFSDVLQVIATGQKSGVLTVSRGASQAKLSFDRGSLQYAQLVPGLHLGELLVRMDLLTTAEVQKLLRAQRDNDDAAYLGWLALEAELLEASELHAAVKAQVMDAVSELCAWKSGAFRFSDGPQKGRYAPLEQPLDTLALLMQVVQQLDDWQKGHVHPDEIFARRGDPSQTSLPEGGWEVLGYVNGRRSAASIAAELDLSERQVYRILYLLQEAGVVTPSSYTSESASVLVLAQDYRLQRLIRLSLQRAGVTPILADDAERGLERLQADHPRAVVVDDINGEGWAFVRELRQLARRSHLPAVLLSSDAPAKGWLARLKRPQAFVLQKPFQELELQQLVTRLLGRRLA